jgi:uncharacterized protein YhbP (UPF0306 family)
MIVDFNNIPNWCKIWIFPSSRKFYDEEMTVLNELITLFLDNWSLEYHTINCAFEIKYNRFIILTADDTDHKLNLKAHNDIAAFILELENKFEVTLLDKINVCYKQGEFVQYKDLIEFKQLMKNNSVSAKTIVFDNMITTKEELEENWEINITDSWLGRFLK